MSHDATNWAIRQRGIKPAAKIVLWQLCDRFHPDFGCFPSQDTLASDCELSRSTLNVHLADLEDAGLIGREQRRRKGSERQESTRYRFPFEPDFYKIFGKKPSPETGHGTGETVSEKQPDPCPENGESRVRNPDSIPVREPVIEPVERDAREGVHEDQKNVEREFWRLVKNWPGFDGMPKEPAKAPFFALTPDDRAEAIDRFPAWIDLLKAQRKSHVPAPSTYIKEMLWKDVPKAALMSSTAAVPNPFSRAWHARRLYELSQPLNTTMPAMTQFQRAAAAAGGEEARKVDLERREKYGWPKVNTMHQRAMNAQGVTVSPRLSLISDSFEKAHKNGDLAAAWQRLHQRNGWPWMVVPDQVEWLYFPPTNGETADIDAAVADAMAEFQAQANEGRTDDAA